MKTNEFLKKNLDLLTKIEKFLEINYFEQALITRIMNEITIHILQDVIKTRYAVFLFLKSLLEKILNPFDVQMDLSSNPSIVLVVGINGTGKTNTIAKMLNLLCKLDYKTMIIECDNYRQGTFENLQQITKNKDIKIFYKQDNDTKILKLIKTGYDYCIENKYNVCLIDTSGRMSENKNLMNEIVSIKNSLKELNSNYPNNIVFIVDATLGYSIIEQIEIFHSKLKLSGVILTKTDLSQNTGIIIVICYKYKIPIHGITEGNNINDIKPFNVKKYIDNFCELLRKFV